MSRGDQSFDQSDSDEFVWCTSTSLFSSLIAVNFTTHVASRILKRKSLFFPMIYFSTLI